MSKRVYIIIVLVLLASPLAICLLSKGQIFSINENRPLSAWPEGPFYTCLTDKGEYAGQINDYFNDRFGLRDLMIRTRNEIDFRVFNTTGDDSVYVTDDGYMLYKSVVAKEQIYNEALSEDDLKRIVSSIEQTKQMVNERGKQFLFMIAPQKNEVFPEWMKGIPVYRPEKNAYIRLCEMIEANNDINNGYIDVLPILRQANELYPVFYKTDFHWNGFGANCAFAAALNKMAEWEGIDVPVFGMDSYNIVPMENFHGGQLNNLPLLEDWAETTYGTERKAESTTEPVPDDAPNAAFHWINRNQEAPLGTVLFIGDSYTEYMMSSQSGILDCFKEGYWVHVDNSAGALDNYLDKVDYVVFERIESGMSTITYYLYGLSGSDKD